MLVTLVILFLLAAWAAPARAVTCPSQGTCWSWQFIGDSYVGATGTFQGDESTTGTQIQGSYQYVSTGFLSLTVSGCTDTAPLGGGECQTLIMGGGGGGGGGSLELHAIEVLGLGLIIQPILPEERQISFNLETGACPGVSFNGNFVVMQWNADGIGSDVSSASQLGFGSTTWRTELVIPSMEVESTFNLVGFNPILSSPVLLPSDSCTNGETLISGNGDRGGVLYFSSSGGGYLYRTNADHTFWGAEALSISEMDRAVLYGTYAGFSFDPSGASGVKSVQVTLGSSLTQADGYEITDVSAGTLNNAYRRVLTIPSGATTLNGITYPAGGGWNYPLSGMISGVVDEGLGGPYGNITCLVVSNVNNRQALFCVGQSSGNNTMPYNLVLANAVGAPGNDDVLFGTNGAAQYNSDDQDYLGYTMALQTDGKIVIGGYTTPSSGMGADDNFSLVRLMPDGSLDTTFGTGGKALANLSFGTSDQMIALTVGTDGKIVGVGKGNDFGPGTGDVAVARFNTDGSLDTSFAGTGYVLQPIGSAEDVANAVAIQTDGKIVVGGNYNTDTNGLDWFVARFNVDGTLDTGFGTAGFTTTTLDIRDDRINGIAIDTAGRIVAAGYQSTSDGFHDIALVRYTSDGALDSTFGWVENGIVTSGDGSADDIARSLALQTDGKILVAGFYDNFIDRNFEVLRFTDVGTLETEFTNPTTPAGVAEEAYALAIQPDGKVVVAGTQQNSNLEIVLFRYGSNGNFDTSFGNSGVRNTSYAFGGSTGLGIAVQPDSRILVGAQTFTYSTPDDFLVFRLWP